MLEILNEIDAFVWGPPLLVLLVGTGILLTFRLKLLQVFKLPQALGLIFSAKNDGSGDVNSFKALCTALAATVGTGNIVGVATAIKAGGPGALFWMWVSAFFGMATSFAESTLSQIFKEKRDNEYVGGLPFYARKLLNDSAAAGVALSMLYIVYALLCFPAQGFNTISAVGAIASKISGVNIPTNSSLYWISFAVLIVITAVISFGGIKKVTKVTDRIVPVMAVIYVLTVIALTVGNLDRIPLFFSSVFTQAFAPDAVFGGAFGLALSQGIKRGLMSNEAGQGTITMPAAAAEVAHPCEQGCVQALGVFLDTIVICTLTGFVVIMGSMWLTADAQAWFELGKLDKFLASCGALTGGNETLYSVVTLLVSVCFGLFAFTCLLGFMSFTEMCANRISSKASFINAIRMLCLIVISFGVITNIAGMDLGALWELSDFANILMVYCNLPLQYIGFKYVLRAWKHFEKNDGTPFTSEIAGLQLPVWDALAKEHKNEYHH